MKGHEQWEELVAGYALNALEPEDEEKLEAHLRGCDPCRRALADLSAVVGEMAYATEPAEPPAELRDRIMAALPETGRTPFFPSDQVTVVRRRRLLAPSAGAARVLAAAAGVLLVALAGWNFRLRADRTDAVAETARLRRTITELATSGAQRVDFTGAGGAKGAFFVARGEAWMIVDGLPRNDRAREQYVVWWGGSDGVMHPVEAFDVPTSDSVISAMTLAVDTDRIKALAISREPGRQLPDHPTGQVVATVQVN